MHAFYIFVHFVEYFFLIFIASFSFRYPLKRFYYRPGHGLTVSHRPVSSTVIKLDDYWYMEARFDLTM